jgi:cell division protein FtsL
MGKAQLIRGLQIVAAILVVVLVVGLYKAKSDASRAEAHVRQLHLTIDETEASNRALNAEIAHLESPAHVEQLAQEHLDVAPGAQSAALPESTMANRLPAPRNRQTGP